ncbi:MAG: tetratricopeptide repeat protein [Deltaproteobacteria bacterium]|nr:tetratricopeptide repeat protein [Deltaproteobacteria bacterium]
MAGRESKEARESKESKKPKEAKEPKESKEPRTAKEPKDSADPKTAKDPVGGDIAVPEGADATDLYYSGKRKLDHGDFAGAIADLRASHKVRASVRTLTLLGRAYFDSDQFALAEKAFKAAGTYDEAMLLLGQLYQQTGKADKARKVYDKFLAAHPDHPKAEWVRKLLQTL